MGNTIGTNIDLFKNQPGDAEVIEKVQEVLVYEIVANIVTALSQEHIAAANLSREELENQVARTALKLGYKMTRELTGLVLAHTVGYGILDEFVTHPEVNNVFVNRHNDVWIQKGLKRYKTEIDFGSNENVQSFVRILQSKLGGEINADKARNTFFDPERNLRIVCVIEPVALNGPSIVIRIHRGDGNFTVNQLIDYGTLSATEATYILDRLMSNQNVVFTGMGATGKTTTMRAMLDALEPERRIMTMEEEAELQLKKANVLAYLVKRNERGQVVGMREFIELGIKSSIDTFVFGENRGEEAFTLVSSAYSGHQVISTLHTKNLKDVPERLAINMLMSGTKVDFDVLLKMIYKSIDVIVLMDSFKVKEIGEVKGSEIHTVSFADSESSSMHRRAVV